MSARWLRPRLALRPFLFLLCSAPLWSSAAPASWYWWHSRLDSDVRVCAQSMPDQGWTRGSGPFNNPRCTADPAVTPRR